MTRNERNQRRFEKELLVLDRAIFMKPLGERQQYVDYQSGKRMGSMEFNNGAKDIFGEYTWPDVTHRDRDGNPAEHCTRQGSLPGFMDFDPVYYQKTRPIDIRTPEQIHLDRVNELKSGVTFCFSEQGRMEAIQTELSQMV